MNRHLLIPVIAITIAGAAALAVTPTSAQATEGNQTSLVQRIATRFNLSESEVQVVFDENRADRQAEMHARFEERLTTAVENGKLTEEQKQIILAKHQELMAAHQAERDELQAMTPAERKAHHEAERAELAAWAEAEGIELQFLLPMGKMGGRHMRGAYGAPADFNKQ